MTSIDASEAGETRGAGDAARSVHSRLRYLVVLSRPRFWFYLAGPVVVGVAYGADSVPELFGTSALVLFSYFLVPANVLLYGINDRFDADIDTVNPKKTGESNGTEGETTPEKTDEANSGDGRGREARWRGDDPLVTAAIILSGVLSLVTIAVIPRLAWPYLGGFIALAIGYSAPPARFKTTPILDSVSNGLYILPGAAAYAAVSGTHPPVAALVGAWVWAMAMHTFSAIPDIEPDRAAGIRTTATVLGEWRTYGYCAGCWALAAIAFALVDPRLGVVLGVYPLFLASVALTDVAVDRAYWWFPALNTGVGAAVTIGGLIRIVHPAEVWAALGVIVRPLLGTTVWPLLGVIGYVA